MTKYSGNLGEKMKRFIFFFVFAIFILMSCGSSHKVTRLSEKEIADLSGNWNDSDSKLTAAAMIYDLTQKPWIENYIKETSKDPVVFVVNVFNRSNQQIEINRFIKNLERELIRSGKVKLAGTADKRKRWRAIITDQHTISSDEAMKQLANDTGAEFMLIGIINSTIDTFDGQKTKVYQINLEMFELNPNSKVWTGNNQIKKIIK